MMILPRNSDGCPYLLLAPMEGVGDRAFRKAMASIGGFDEGVQDFLRVPANAHIKSLATRYQSNEITPFPLAAQLMGSDISLMAEMTREMEARGAPRVDLNCGCPSNTVTGKGAGSSLLKDPNHLYTIAKAMVDAVSIPVTAKLRSGFEDTSLFKENLLAAQESGIQYLTLHPRTKVDGYGPPARWDLIAEAKSFLRIPVVGNGDILTVADACKMLQNTGCDALMIGRGSIINPFLFHEIKAHFSGKPYVPQWEQLLAYFTTYMAETPVHLPERTKINRMKQLLGFFCKGTPALLDRRQEMLQTSDEEVGAFFKSVRPYLENGWR